MDRSFDLVLLLRFLAICAAAVMAYVLRLELRIGYVALAIVAAAAILNFAVYWLSPDRFSRFRRRASPIVGICCWAALMAVTGGIGSPFIAGLSMEIVLSTLAVSPLGIMAVASGATMALIVQQALPGYETTAWALTLHGSFLLGIGLATAFITRRWSRTRDEFVSQSQELGSRLDSLERELADERTLSQMGERVARLAHGLKNAIHSLRGFASLIERKLAGGAGQEALDGRERPWRGLFHTGQLIRQSGRLVREFGRLARESQRGREFGLANRGRARAVGNETVASWCRMGLQWKRGCGAGGDVG